MGLTTLKTGKTRLQVRRKGFPVVDKVFDNREDAIAALEKALQKQRPVHGDTSLNILWGQYIESREFSEKAENTQKTEKSRIKPILLELGYYSLKNLEQKTEVIYDYMDKRAKAISPKTKRKLSGTSIRLEIAALSALVEFAKKRKMVHANFVSPISRPATKKRKRRIAPTEMGKVKLWARHCDERLAKAACFIILVRHLGCRPGELQKLKVRDISLQRRELLFVDTKNGTDRRVHVTKDAAEIIHLQLPEVPDGCEYLFASRSRNGQWSPYNYSHGVALLKEHQVVEPDFHMHAGRREFISRAIESNIPYATIRKQTGHKSTQALEIYDEGLSTAPEVRAELDRLAEKVTDEDFDGLLKVLSRGLTGEQKQKFNSILKEVKGDDGWVSPWDAAAVLKARRK